MSNTKITTYTFGTSKDELIERKKHLVDKFKENVIKELCGKFKTSEEKNAAKIALEVSSALLLEYFKNEAEYGR
ncbi:hypothetical protein [Clostridium tyrobutyricum]|uniref:hypothetical protein n=1 Tax=Clostridium tyrobutyricum TaxID=1519 RepID=UPI001C38FB86|nr:hypothetical protein [Clostridium tyrobutyricum]MBV4415114.1 hypothetical protein [Clostridium tyrobutyricum]